MDKSKVPRFLLTHPVYCACVCVCSGSWHGLCYIHEILCRGGISHRICCSFCWLRWWSVDLSSYSLSHSL